MASFCLLPDAVEKFKKGLVDREIDPLKLSLMESGARRDFLEKYVGKDNAVQVNSLFESKLLLKNQKAGYITWAKKIGGLTPQVRRDLVTKIEKLDRVLNPAEEKSFLHDLASTKLGTDVTAEEAKGISDLSHQVSEAKKTMQEDFTFKSEADRLAYGKSVVNLTNYINELKGGNKFDIKSLADIGGISKSIRASLDDSAIFRQGWKTLFTNPVTWAKNAALSFHDLVKEVGTQKVMDEILADRESRINELNGNYKKMGLAVGKAEEYFPTTLPEKVPVLGRLYKASETAFTGFVYRQRMDIADKYLQIAKDQKTDLTDNQLKAIGSMVNSLTGRANMGKLEGSATGLLNNVFFSVRNVKSQFDTVGHMFTGAGGSNFVRRQSAINLIKVVSGIAAIMTIANAVKPGSAETDPRSSDCGKIKIGDTRFDISGDMSSMVTLAMRLATQSTKSSITGKITPINSGDFGAKTGKDVVVDYMTNKLSPVGQVVTDILNQQDRNGNKLTVWGELANLGVPLSGATAQELLSDPNSAPFVISMIADMLGIATNTYTATPKNWSQNPTKTQQQFLDKVGKDKFKQANDDFNTQYANKLQSLMKNSTYKNSTDAQKQAILNKTKDNIQKNIFKEYNFKYKMQKQSTSDKIKIKELSK